MHQLEVELDVNSEIYPMEVKEHYDFAISTSLTNDGAPDFDLFQYAHERESIPSLMDSYHYVMNGKIFKCIVEGEKLSIFVSFGGLLMRLTGAPKNLKGFEMDSRIFLLMKKV